MSIFDNKRPTNETFKLDVERMRRGWYSDKYFENIGRMLTTLAAEGYAYSGAYPNLPVAIPAEDIAVLSGMLVYRLMRLAKTLKG